MNNRVYNNNKKYVSTHVQIFRVPYRTRFGNNHGFISRGQSFSHSARSMN